MPYILECEAMTGASDIPNCIERRCPGKMRKINHQPQPVKLGDDPASKVTHASMLACRVAQRIQRVSRVGKVIVAVVGQPQVRTAEFSELLQKSQVSPKRETVFYSYRDSKLVILHMTNYVFRRSRQCDLVRAEFHQVMNILEKC